MRALSRLVYANIRGEIPRVDGMTAMLEGICDKYQQGCNSELDSKNIPGRGGIRLKVISLT
jgi:hypothetical protein